MPHKYDLIVFDWDGTLADSVKNIVDAIYCASIDVGLEPPNDYDSRSIIGLELTMAVHTLFPAAETAKVHKLAERYRHHYSEREHVIPLFEGVPESISELSGRGFHLAVATGKGRGGLNRALESSGLQQYFQASRCVDECFSKPHPQMLHELMDEFGATPERTLMIGDTSFDLQMAQNAVVAGLAVTYGAHPLDELQQHGPLACFDSFNKLHQWLKSNA